MLLLTGHHCHVMLALKSGNNFRIGYLFSCVTCICNWHENSVFQTRQVFCKSFAISMLLIITILAAQLPSYCLLYALLLSVQIFPEFQNLQVL